MKLKPHEKGLLIAAGVIALLMFVVLPNAMGEDWRIVGNQYGDTYDSTILWRYLDASLVDSAIGTNKASWDTTLASISAGMNFLVFGFWNVGDTFSNGSRDMASRTWQYVYSEGVTLTDDQIDSIAVDVTAGVLAGGLTGTGSDTVVLYAVDTSASPDSIITYTKITVNSAGSRILSGLNVENDGYIEVHLDPGTYSVVALAPGYHFPTYTLVVSGNSDSTSVPGYDTHSPSKSVVYGYLGDIMDNQVGAAWVYAQRVNCKNATIDGGGAGTSKGISGYVMRTPVDTGYFSMSLINSDEYDQDSCGYYNIWCGFDDSKEGEIWRLNKVWLTSDLNVMDSLAARN